MHCFMLVFRYKSLAAILIFAFIPIYSITVLRLQQKPHLFCLMNRIISLLFVQSLSLGRYCFVVLFCINFFFLKSYTHGAQTSSRTCLHIKFCSNWLRWWDWFATVAQLVRWLLRSNFVIFGNKKLVLDRSLLCFSTLWTNWSTRSQRNSFFFVVVTYTFRFGLLLGRCECTVCARAHAPRVNFRNRPRSKTNLNTGEQVDESEQKSDSGESTGCGA